MYCIPHLHLIAPLMRCGPGVRGLDGGAWGWLSAGSLTTVSAPWSCCCPSPQPGTTLFCFSLSARSCTRPLISTRLIHPIITWTKRKLSFFPFVGVLYNIIHCMLLRQQDQAVGPNSENRTSYSLALTAFFLSFFLHNITLYSLSYSLKIYCFIQSGNHFKTVYFYMLYNIGENKHLKHTFSIYKTILS